MPTYGDSGVMDAGRRKLAAGTVNHRPPPPRAIDDSRQNGQHACLQPMRALADENCALEARIGAAYHGDGR